MTEQNICHFCGVVLKDSDIREFDDTILCEHCLHEHTTLCDCCMDRIWRNEAEGNHTSIRAASTRESSFFIVSS